MKKASNKNWASLTKGKIASKKATQMIKQLSQRGWNSFKYKSFMRRGEAERKVRIYISVSMNKYKNDQEEREKERKK